MIRFFFGTAIAGLAAIAAPAQAVQPVTFTSAGIYDPGHAVWAELIVGFAVVGIVSRGRRTTMTTVAA